jgi:zinc-ribbon domain
MHCPHCGTKNEEGNRYCVSCGSELPEWAGTAVAEVALRERVGRLIGTTRRARLLTAATAGAILIAIGAFLTLKPSEDAAPEDSFTRAIDQTCVTKKQTIAALERQTVQRQPANIEAFSGALVTIVEEWRQDLQGSAPPPVHAEAVQALDSALLDILIRSGGLARATRSGGAAEVTAQAQLVDAASAQVDRAIDGLGLSRCSEVKVGSASVDQR